MHSRNHCFLHKNVEYVVRSFFHNSQWRNQRRAGQANFPPGSSDVGLFLEMGPLIRFPLLPKQFYKF